MKLALSYLLLLGLSFPFNALHAQEDGVSKGLLVAGNEYPELVLTRSESVSCTGALIGPKTFVIAAHCLSDRTPVIHFTYKGAEYKAIAIQSDAYETQKHDLALAIVIGKIRNPQPASILTAGLMENIVVRLFSYGCSEQGELSTEFDTLRMGDTYISQIGEIAYTVKNPSSSTECFSKLGAPAVSYSPNHRYIVGISPDISSEYDHTLLRMDTPQSLALYARAKKNYGAKICGYNVICENNVVIEP